MEYGHRNDGEGEGVVHTCTDGEEYLRREQHRTKDKCIGLAPTYIYGTHYTSSLTHKAMRSHNLRAYKSTFLVSGSDNLTRRVTNSSWNEPSQ